MFEACISSITNSSSGRSSGSGCSCGNSNNGNVVIVIMSHIKPKFTLIAHVLCYA